MRTALQRFFTPARDMCLAHGAASRNPA